MCSNENEFGTAPLTRIVPRVTASSRASRSTSWVRSATMPSTGRANVRPITAATRSSDRDSSSRYVSRDRVASRMLGGRGREATPPGSPGPPVAGFSCSSATRRWVIESMYNGLPLVARCTLRTTDSPAGSPAICSTSNPTCDSVSPRSGITRPSRASLVRITSVPERAASSPRYVPTTRIRPWARSRATKCSNRSESWSAACRSSRTTTSGDPATDSWSSVVTASNNANWTGGASSVPAPSVGHQLDNLWNDRNESPQPGRVDIERRIRTALAQHRTEHLGPRPVRRGTALLPAAPPHNRDPAVLGLLADGSGQVRLADSRLAFEEEQRAVSRSGGVEAGDQRVELPLASDQGRARSGGHLRLLRRSRMRVGCIVVARSPSVGPTRCVVCDVTRCWARPAATASRHEVLRTTTANRRPTPRG